MINNWVKPLTSLKLTVFCLGCAMILVFLGTLDQVNIGVYEAENRYFKSFFLYFTPPGTTLKIPWFPSGYLVGGLLLVNLIAAHLARFKFSWKKAGVLVLHSGVILLLLGQLFTSLFQVESQMRLDQGETKNYSLSYYHKDSVLICPPIVLQSDRDRSCTYARSEPKVPRGSSSSTSAWWYPRFGPITPRSYTSGLYLKLTASASPLLTAICL